MKSKTDKKNFSISSEKSEDFDKFMCKKQLASLKARLIERIEKANSNKLIPELLEEQCIGHSPIPYLLKRFVIKVIKQS